MNSRGFRRSVNCACGALMLFFALRKTSEMTAKPSIHAPPRGAIHATKSQFMHRKAVQFIHSLT